MIYKQNPRLAGRGKLIDKNNHQYINHSILERNYCYCRAGTACIYCLTWNRLIRQFEARQMAWGTMV